MTIITANNVFAHIDNPSDFLAGVRKIISSDNMAYFVFEVSYLKDVIENTFFDTIYHEHLDYHSLLSLRGFLKRNGFEIIDALKVATHMEVQLEVISQKIGGKYKISESVNKLISEEYNAGLHELSTFVQFSNQIEKTKENTDILKDQELNIEYVSPMALAQRSQELQSIMRGLELFGSMAQAMPVMDYIDENVYKTSN